jgi:hypothetical protein
MKARLVQLEDGRPVASTPIRGRELRIGRDPTCDVVLDFARVSRRHAVVRELGDRHTVADAGSSNGTTVNGLPNHGQPVLLKPGDVIELAQTVALVYEIGAERRPTAWIAAAAAMLVLLGVLAAAALWRSPAPDPVLQRAAAVAGEGHRALAAGQPAAAKERFQQAAGLLFRGGHLDDVPRQRVMRVAMERLGAELGRQQGARHAVDLWVEFQTALEDSAPKLPEKVETERGCRLDEVSASQLPACLRERIELVLIGLRQDPRGIPPGFEVQVGRRMGYERELLEKALARGRPLVPMLREELEKAKMPPLLHYVALIESGYDPNAQSPADAVGLWQFVPATARRYGLRLGPGGDERRDPVRSTQAAARYLRDLAFEFGGDALLLALAGYNRGENGVRRALKRLDDPFSDRSYWRLVEEGLLPRETSKYVTRFVAAAVAGEAGLPSPAQLAAAGYGPPGSPGSGS